MSFVFLNEADMQKKSAYLLQNPWKMRIIVALSYYLPCKFPRCFGMLYFFV